MKLLEKMCVQLSEQYSLLKGPKLEWKALGNKGEAYSCKYAGGIITLEAQSSLAAAYGLSRLIMGVSSGYLSDCIGDHNPHVRLRLLVLKLDGTPEKTMPLYCSEICQRVIELGYNSLVIAISDQYLSSMHELCLKCHEYGLKIFIQHPLNEGKFNPFKDEDRRKITTQLGIFFQHCFSCDGIFWEGGHFDEEGISKESTTLDIIKSEVSLIESAIPDSKHFIYALLPKSQKEAKEQVLWLNSILNVVGKHTYIALSALEGDSCSDHLNPHPLWEMLRRNRMFRERNVIPIFNIGSYKQGEGLWPSIIFDIIDFISSCRKYPLEGAIGIVNQLPKQGSFLECNLWSASKAFWMGENAADSIEMWFKSRRPDIDYGKMKGILQQIRNIALEISYLHSLTEMALDSNQKEYFRAVLEALFVQLKRIEVFLEQEERGKMRKSTQLSMRDYFSFFANDAKRVIHQFMHTFHIASPLIRTEIELKEGFWMDSKMGMLQFPFKGNKGSRMESIYLENRLIEV